MGNLNIYRDNTKLDECIHRNEADLAQTIKILFYYKVGEKNIKAALKKIEERCKNNIRYNFLTEINQHMESIDLDFEV